MTPEQHGSKTEGRGDDLARQERIAELERELRRLRSPEVYRNFLHDDRIKELEAFLSRLRDEGGGELCQTCGASYEQTSIFHKPKNACPTCGAASPSDLPAREAVEGVALAIHNARFAHPEHPRDPEPWDKGDREYAFRLARAAVAALQPLSQGNGEAVGADHKSIWLSPVCDREHCDNCRDDRTWHEDRLPICDECGAVPTQYIRADLYAAPPSQPEGVREALEALRKTLYPFQKVTDAGKTDDYVVLRGDRVTAGQLRAVSIAVRNLAMVIASSTPSRGLVEAAEWRPIETAPRDGSIIIIDTKPSEPTWLPFTARLIEGHYDFPAGTVWTTAPPRTLSAKPTAIAADREGDRDA